MNHKTFMKKRTDISRGVGLSVGRERKFSGAARYINLQNYILTAYSRR